MRRAAYTALLWLVLPLALAWLWWQGLRNPALRIDWAQRFGRGARNAGPAPVWIHAVSVGEIQSAVTLVARLRERDTQTPILMTMATATGMQRAAALFGRDVQLCYAPLDLPFAVRGFLQRRRPSLAIFLETELWPNLLAGCEAHNVPVVLLSARLSERSLGRYRRHAPRLLREALARIRFIAAQSDADAARFIALGADPARVATLGSLKFDLEVPASLAAQSQLLRERYVAQRAAWVAGSTHDGEEAQCLAAHRRLCAAWPATAPAPLLVLVPRHPQRFDEVAQWLEAQDVAFVRRSDATATVTDAVQVLLVDTLGELLAWYAATRIAFVGGSLVPIGGHNLLEPAAVARPILAGPHSFNSPDAARLLEGVGALAIVRDERELAGQLSLLFGDAAVAQRRGEAGRAALLASRGALPRSLALLAPLLPSR